MESPIIRRRKRRVIALDVVPDLLLAFVVRCWCCCVKEPRPNTPSFQVLRVALSSSAVPFSLFLLISQLILLRLPSLFQVDRKVDKNIGGVFAWPCVSCENNASVAQKKQSFVVNQVTFTRKFEFSVNGRLTGGNGNNNPPLPLRIFDLSTWLKLTLPCVFVGRSWLGLGGLDVQLVAPCVPKNDRKSTKVPRPPSRKRKIDRRFALPVRMPGERLAQAHLFAVMYLIFFGVTSYPKKTVLFKLALLSYFFSKTQRRRLSSFGIIQVILASVQDVSPADVSTKHPLELPRHAYVPALQRLVEYIVVVLGDTPCANRRRPSYVVRHGCNVLIIRGAIWEISFHHFQHLLGCLEAVVWTVRLLLLHQMRRLYCWLFSTSVVGGYLLAMKLSVQTENAR